MTLSSSVDPGVAVGGSCDGGSLCYSRIAQGLRSHGLLSFDRDTDRPDEADELTGDRGDHVRRGFPPREEAAIATAEALLRFPGEGRDRLGLAALALPEALRALRREAVRPGGLDQDAAEVGVAGLGDRPAVDVAPARVLARHRAAVAHEFAGMREAGQRPDLAHDGRG